MIHLMQLAPCVSDLDLESVFSHEDEQTPGTILSIAYSGSESEENSHPTNDSDDNSQLSYILKIFHLEPQTTPSLLPELALTPDRPYPSVKL